MPRALALAALVLALAPVRAQTPDPTDPARYYPLDVGNVWEYLVSEKMDYYAERIEITRDTVIGGVQYVVEEYRRRTPSSSTWGPADGAVIRFDVATSRVNRLFSSGGELVWHWGGCPLDAPFGSVAACWEPEQSVRGGLGMLVTLGDSSRVAVAALKSFGEADYTFASDLGFVRKIGLGGETRLRYARIRGREYGTRFAVAAEPPPAPAGIALRSVGQMLVLSARDAGPVRLDLFDALGRRVASVFEGALGTGERRFSLPAVAPGLYVAQAIQGASRASVRVVVVR